MYTNDPQKKKQLNRLYITHNKTEEYNHENLSFVEILSACCRLITERKDNAGDNAINKWLYLILNLSPILERQESSYLEIIKGGITPAKIDKLKERLCYDLGTVLKWVSATPIVYDKPEEDLAKLHFNGAFGQGIPDKNSYGFRVSWATDVFDLSVYKQIRSAFTVEELELIESKEKKLSVLYILTGYYIDKYCETVSSILRQAGLNNNVYFGGTQQEKLYEFLFRLSRDRFNEFLVADGVTPPTKEGKKLILDKAFCDRSKQEKLIKFLDSLVSEFKIGTRACKKGRFARIAYTLARDLSCWKEKRYAPSKKALSDFYGLPLAPTYKINESDYSEFIKSPEGKKLRNLIKKFNESLEQ